VIKKLIIFMGAFMGAVLLLTVSFSSVINIYEKRHKISIFLKYKTGASTAYEISEKDVYWAKEVLKGGYILHFRHAERDKWIDLQVYDALESDAHNNGQNESRYAENDYFDKAVCLNDRGKIQAKAIGESLKFIGLPIGAVHSSVSCRARQTANLAFGGYDELHRILVHKGPYNESEDVRVKRLEDLYLGFEEIEGKNTIVSAHNSVISCDMFIDQTCPSNNLSLEEGGFYILRNTKDGLRFEYEFHNFKQFNRVFYQR
jgi:phosphohistidine phosphatase SixA